MFSNLRCRHSRVLLMQSRTSWMSKFYDMLATNTGYYVYAYIWPNAAYVTVVGIYRDEYWLVMFSMEGIMETAFPPTDSAEYLSDPRFQYIGTIQELLQ